MTTTNMFCTFNEMWANSFMGLYEGAHECRSRLGKTYETLGYHGVLLNPDQAWLTNKGRGASARYAAAELLWYLSGYGRVEMLSYYAPSYVKYVRPDGEAPGAYGARWKDGEQLFKVFRILQEKPDSRQAVMTCFNMLDQQRAINGDVDIPCTLTLQFIIRNDRLYAFVNMRSNDVWLGMPYDVWAFTRLQSILASLLGVELGAYVHNVGSLHLYETNIPRDMVAFKEEGLTNAQVHRAARPTKYQRWSDFDAELSRALAIEQAFRLNWSTLTSNALTLLEKPSLLAECVVLCASKNPAFKEFIPDWFDRNLLPNTREK